MKSLILIHTAVMVFVTLTPCVQGAREFASSKDQAITSQMPAIKAEPLDLLKGLEGYAAEDLIRTFNRSNKKLCIVNKTSDNQGSEKEQGTLRYCIESAKNAKKDEMTWIIFDPRVFGANKNQAIELREELAPGSNTIIDGRGAKVTICSTRDIHLLTIRDAKNIMFRNLILHKVAPFAREKFKKNINFSVSSRPGTDINRAAQGVDRDGISIRGISDNIWIDHCTLFLCGDESIGVSSASGLGNTKIIVSWCEFSDQYYVALIGHTKEDKKYDQKIRLTFHHNRIKGAARRSPRVNRATADVYNNYLEGWVDWGMAANASSKVLVEGNIFEASQSTNTINIGTTTQTKGFVRIKNNALINGAELDSYIQSKVQIPDYERTISKADDNLKELLKLQCGWQNMSVDFSKLLNRR